MADKKVTQLTSLTTPASEDLMLVIDNPNGTPTSKQITVKICSVVRPVTQVLLGHLPFLLTLH